MKRTPNEQIGRRISKLMAMDPCLTTQTALANATGLGQSTIGRILRGESDTSAENLKEIATALGTTLEYLMFGSVTTISVAPDRTTRVPLVEMENVKDWLNAAREKREELVKKWIFYPQRCGANTVATTAAGDKAYPTIDSGDVIFIDPDFPQSSGKIVAILENYGLQITPKTLVIEGDKKIGKLISPDWPAPKYEEVTDDRILGVVIGKWTDLAQ